MDEKEFDRMYLGRDLKETVTSIRIFRDLDLPKIRLSLPRGYAHTPEQEIRGVIRLLDKLVERGHITFEDVRDNREEDYELVMSCMMKIQNRCKYPL